MGYEVVVEAVEEEAKEWQHMADDMMPVADNVEALELGPLAFLVVSPSLMPGGDALVLSAAYEEMRKATGDQLRGAAVEFDEIAGALVKCADAYEKAEKFAGDEFDYEKIYSK